MTQTPTVILLRGIPGSSKSYTSKKILSECDCGAVVCSADDYFMYGSTYIWDKNKLGAAHAACLNKFKVALQEKVPLILVDNCNIKWSDCKAYVKAAADAGYKISLVESASPWAKMPILCFLHNQHDVPLETILRMSENYQPNEVVAQFAKENLGVILEYKPH